MFPRTRIIALTVGTILSSGAPHAATLTLEPACGGSGFSGTAQDGAVGVRFESCGGKDWCQVKVWKASGDELTEMVTQGTTQISLWTAGVPLSATPMKEDQLAKVQAAMESPEADLVRCMFEPFRARKSTLPEGAIACFEGHGQAYEGQTKAPCPSWKSNE